MTNKIQMLLLISFVLLISSMTSYAEKSKAENINVESLGQLKAALKAPSGKAYFFTDKKYYRQNLSKDKLEKSAVIEGNFKKLVNNFDAALLHTNGKGYFFKGGDYYRYNFYSNSVDKIGEIGKSGWKGVPSNIDAAVVHSNGKAYFFKGSQYYRYNSGSNKVDKIDVISKNWKGVPNDVDAALMHTNGKIYFFKGNKYYRYSIPNRKVDKIGTIGVDGWKGLSFSKELKNVTASSKHNKRLKVTLNRIKSIQARDSDDIADFLLEQSIEYTPKGIRKLPLESIIKRYKFDKEEIKHWEWEDRPEDIVIENIIIRSIDHHFHIREGDENHFINNSLIYEISPNEIEDKRAVFKLHTYLGENDGDADNWFTKNIFKLFASGSLDVKRIARDHYIDVDIYEVLNYLQNPNSSKYDGNYFKGGKNGKMHEYGAFGDVMWMKKGSNNSLIGHLEFGDNNKETYVRFYYRFELVD